MERLFKQYDKLNSDCEYRIVRYGNVLYSTGSVLCKWRNLISKGEKCIVTDLDATRFYWTVDEAVDLIFECMDKAESASPWCPDMKSMKIRDLLEAMYLKYCPDTRVEPEVIGLQPGENKHEKVMDEGPFSKEVVHYTIEEIKNLI